MSKLSSFQERLKSQKLIKIPTKKIILVTAVVSMSGVMPLTHTVHANRYDTQIGSLQQQNSQNTEKQQSLRTQEQDINAAIAELEANITTIESQISKNRAKNKQLKDKIAEAKKEIEKQRKLLGTNVRQLYLDDQMSTLEKLASSKSFGDYVDKEQYRVSVQSKIKTTMDKIEELKKEQESQKAAIEKLLKDQQTMQSQLKSQKAESVRLRKLNRQQQANFTAEISANNSRIAQLQREQAEENRRHRLEAIRAAEEAAKASRRSSPVSTATSNSAPKQSNSSSRSSSSVSSSIKSVRGSSYPYANHPFPNSIVDPWGMYTRQCVSYTAWKVAASGRHMPYWGGRGNAKQWDDNARATGIPVDTTPRVGDVAISNSGYYGHSMYVEAVYGDGTIYVSDYNANWTGEYSEYRRSAAGLVFIHF